jgi:Putative DNA-binding domain
MLPSELANKPIHTWTLDDLNLIVARQSEESQFLEFKEQLPLNDGAKGWTAGQKLHRSEKDGLAKEIVALANAYGGHVIVGICESDDNPKRAASLAALIPRLANFVESLRSSLGDLIDPPINALMFQPILEQPASDTGYLVVKVPQSIHAPHGYGRPPEAHVRRADKSEPMTMRDMQNVFWEARTRRERIDIELSNFALRFRETAAIDDGIVFGICAVSENSLQVGDLEQMLSFSSKQALGLNFRFGTYRSVAKSPENFNNWVRSPFGHRLSFSYSDYSGDWSIDETGIVTLLTSTAAQPMPLETDGSGVAVLRTSPKFYLDGVKQFIDLLRVVHAHARPANDKWILKLFFKKGFRKIDVKRDEWDDPTTVNFGSGIELRPLNFDFSDPATSLTSLEGKVWDCFGGKPQHVSPDFVTTVLGDWKIGLPK